MTDSKDIGHLEGQMEMLISSFENFHTETREHYKTFDEILRSHSRRISALEHFRWWLAGIGAAIMLMISWLKLR